MEDENSASRPKKLQTSQPSLFLFLLLPHDEIIEKVLSKLPVKSLLRFRCVSKSWNSIIGNKGFIKAHLKNSTKIQSFPHQSVILHNMHDRPNQCSVQSLLNEQSIPPSPLDVHINTASTNFRILGCCNGLVCVLDERGDFFLWNPSTKISKKLPRIFRAGDDVLVYGFGWVESSDEYKVFALIPGLQYGGNVYSSKTKSWKTIKQSIINLRFTWEEGVFVGGKLHWPCKNFILTFDLKREEYGEMKVPSDQEPCFDTCLGVIGGCLCMIYYSLKGRGNRVWVEKDGFWKKLVTLGHVLELLERPFSSPFALIENREILLFHGSTFLIYSSLDEAFRCPKVFCRYQSQHLYVESLVSPEFL